MTARATFGGARRDSIEPHHVMAGLEEVDQGSIWIGDRDVTDLPAGGRDIAMDAHICTFRWGDGVTDTVPADRSPCSASHAYPVGDHTVSVSVADDDGGLDDAERSLLVYGWAGFFAPVDNPPAWNAMTAGQAIPLKFGLGGYQGMKIFADGFPASRPCRAPAPALRGTRCRRRRRAAAG
jgi:hypothetical protein